MLGSIWAGKLEASLTRSPNRYMFRGAGITAETSAGIGAELSSKAL